MASFQWRSGCAVYLAEATVWVSIRRDPGSVVHAAVFAENSRLTLRWPTCFQRLLGASAVTAYSAASFGALTKRFIFILSPSCEHCKLILVSFNAFFFFLPEFFVICQGHKPCFLSVCTFSLIFSVSKSLSFSYVSCTAEDSTWLFELGLKYFLSSQWLEPFNLLSWPNPDFSNSAIPFNVYLTHKNVIFAWALLPCCFIFLSSFFFFLLLLLRRSVFYIIGRSLYISVLV